MLLALMSLLGGLYFLFDAITIIAPKEFDPITIVVASLLLTFVGPLLPLAAIGFFLSQIKLGQRASLRLLFILIPYICYTFGAFMVTEALGFNHAADYLLNGHMMPGNLMPDQMLRYKIFEFVTFEMFRWVMVFNLVALTIAIVYTMAVSDFKPGVISRALFKSGPMRPFHLIGLLFFIFIALSYFRFSNTGHWMMHEDSFSTTIYVAKAITIFLIGLFGYHSQKPAIYLINKHNTPHFDDLPILKPMTNWRDESGEDEYRLPILQNDFHHLMHEKQCFRRPGLSIYSVASELEISAESLNHMIRSIYGINYTTYVKVQRVAFAKRYHAAHPDFPAETVAMESGFRSAAQMRQHFKEAAYVIQKNES